MDKDKGYDGSEEGSVDERNDQVIKRYLPLVFICGSQPNMLISAAQLGKKIQISCFDISVKMCATEFKYCRKIPTEQEFAIDLLETKSGDPHPVTGVLPAFFTLRWSKNIGRPNLDIEIAKPVKVFCSINRWIYLIHLKDNILEALSTNIRRQTVCENVDIKIDLSNQHHKMRKPQKNIENYSKFTHIKDNLYNISILNIKLAQIYFVMKTESGTKLNLCVGKFHNRLTISNRPERITNVIKCDYITMGITENNVTRLLINPWSVSFEVLLFWEPWQSSNSNPQIQVSMEGDSLNIDVSPEHIRCLKVISKEISNFLNINKVDSNLDKSAFNEILRVPSNDKEQHYKDDLRAGAFHFVDSTNENIDELPLAYQVMFWNRNFQAMAWRYPQPRALTKVRIFPIPFNIPSGGNEEQRILCYLEYWSECQGQYISYIPFHLSETEVYYLDLPQNGNRPVVACTWRIVLSGSKNEHGCLSKVLISPRALAGCVRVDSYFNKVLIPELTLAANISSVNISFYNNIEKELPYRMPKCLSEYQSDLLFPTTQSFLSITLLHMKTYFATWHFESVAFESSVTIKSEILDYQYLTQQPLIKQFQIRAQGHVNKLVDVNIASEPICIMLGASSAHTLAVSSQLWNEAFTSDPKAVNFIIITHYVICNDTDVNLRFGQLGSEDILLLSRHCHLYSWRSQKSKQAMRVALETLQWTWSETFRIDQDGTQICNINMSDAVAIVITVKSISATQKMVIFSGQLIICNTLLEHFQLKVIEAVEKDKDKEFRNARTRVINGKSIPPSIIINSNKKYFLRVKFYGIESAWSGDIPLSENTKSAQPWLVKGKIVIK